MRRLVCPGKLFFFKTLPWCIPDTSPAFLLIMARPTNWIGCQSTCFMPRVSSVSCVRLRELVYAYLTFQEPPLHHCPFQITDIQCGQSTWFRVILLWESFLWESFLQYFSPTVCEYFPPFWSTVFFKFFYSILVYRPRLYSLVPVTRSIFHIHILLQQRCLRSWSLLLFVF